MARRDLLVFFLGVGASVFVPSRPARASSELSADLEALSTARAAYGPVLHLKPRLLERGERLSLSLPPELLNPKDASCTSVVVLGVKGLHFVLRFSQFDPGAPSTAFPESSAAGALEVTRCGAGKPFLGDMVIELRSPRGVLETLVSNAPAGVPPLLQTLPNRDPGDELGLGDPGARPALPPVSQRVERVEMRARREGAASIERAEWIARNDGSGGAALSLTAGCHELTLLDTTKAVLGVPAVDLDLELVDQETGTALAVDRADDADATGSLCLGSPSTVELRFAGATPDAHLLLTHARWELPNGLPKSWGSDTRAKLAQVARVSHLQPQHSPIYASLGVQGTTQLPFQMEPDACYTVLLAPLRGEVLGLSLSAIAHTPGQVARGSTDLAGSALSFCARGATHATLEVDGRGSSLAWIVAAWETGRSAPGLGDR